MQGWRKYFLKGQRVKYSSLRQFIFFLSVCPDCVTILLPMVTHTLLPFRISSQPLCGSAAISQLCSTTFLLLESPDPGNGTQSSPSLWLSNQCGTGHKTQIGAIRILCGIVYRHWERSAGSLPLPQLYGKCSFAIEENEVNTQREAELGDEKRERKWE